MATDPASKLATKVARMAPNGYYVAFYGTLDEDLSKPESFEVQHIKDGAARYIHFLFATGAPGGSWNVLTWSCALTKSLLASEQKAPALKKVRRTLYFATHAELLKFPHIGLQPGALVPSPLDI